MTSPIDQILRLARDGCFGTPDNPNRGSSAKAAFWNAFNNVKAVHNGAKGSTCDNYSKAGKLYRKEIRKHD